MTPCPSSRRAVVARWRPASRRSSPLKRSASSGRLLGRGACAAPGGERMARLSRREVAALDRVLAEGAGRGVSQAYSAMAVGIERGWFGHREYANAVVAAVVAE